MIEVNTTLKFEDKEPNEKKSHFEIVYISIIKIDEDVKEKKDLEKIILCDVQNEIYPKIRKMFFNLLHNSGFPEVKLKKKLILKNYIMKNLIKKNFSLNLLLNNFYVNSNFFIVRFNNFFTI